MAIKKNHRSSPTQGSPPAHSPQDEPQLDVPWGQHEVPEQEVNEGQFYRAGYDPATGRVGQSPRGRFVLTEDGELWDIWKDAYSIS